MQKKISFSYVNKYFLTSLVKLLAIELN